jgi:hypothetical protein
MYPVGTQAMSHMSYRFSVFSVALVIACLWWEIDTFFLVLFSSFVFFKFILMLMSSLVILALVVINEQTPFYLMNMPQINPTVSSLDTNHILGIDRVSDQQM